MTPFHYSSKLQTWLQTCFRLAWACRKHVASRSKACWKHADSQLQTCLKPSDDRTCVTYIYIRPIFRKMDDEDEIVVACTAVVVYSLDAEMIAAKSKKRKHSTWVTVYQRPTEMTRIALCFQKWKPMIWVDTCSNFRMDVGDFCVP